jgi:hypothetical protein
VKKRIEQYVRLSFFGQVENMGGCNKESRTSNNNNNNNNAKMVHGCFRRWISERSEVVGFVDDGHRPLHQLRHGK